MHCPFSSSELIRLHALLAAFVFTLTACLIYTMAGRVLGDPDTFWHVQVGHDIWQAKALPTRDQYSFTFLGKPWIAKEWLSQLAYYSAYRTGGWDLVVVVAALAVSSAITLLFLALSTRLRATLAMGIALLAAFAASGTYLARPHILTFPLLIAWAHYLLNASEKDRAPSFWLLPLIVLWTNLHASFPLAFVIAGLCFLNFLERNRLSKPAESTLWVLFLTACALATLVNPYGYRVPLVTLQFLRGNEAMRYISEWQATELASSMVHMGLILSVLASLLYIGIKLRVAKIIFFLFVLYMFFEHFRFSYIFYFLAPLIVAPEIEAQHPRLSAAGWVDEEADPVMGFLRRYGVWLGTGFALVLAAVTAAFLLLANVRQRPEIAPRAALAYARAAGLTGHVLNYYDFGGFLIFNGVKTFVDGRADQIFNGGFMGEIAATEKPDGGAVLAGQLKKYDITWTLLPPSDPRVIVLDRMPDWKRAYSDKFAVIHVPTS